jgi:hypothetical protein
MYRSDFTYTRDGYKGDAASYIYYNADIINNNTGDADALQQGVIDPPVRFNETRDTALVKNASEYYFSIIRFTMDGPNKDLPLFIPDINEGTGQVNVNLTNYGVAIGYNQQWNITIGGNVITTPFIITPPVRFIVYSSETRNTTLAPTPTRPCATTFRGQYAGGTTYQPGDIVSTAAADPIYNTWLTGPFYQVNTPALWNATTQYAIGSFVLFGGLAYYAIGVPPIGVAPVVGPNWVLGLTGIVPTNTTYWSPIAANQGNPQDLSSRYYWVYSYQQWLDLVNQTLLLAHQDTYTAFSAAWTATGTTTPFPYPTFADYQAEVMTPQIIYTPGTTRFTIFGDSDAYGQRILTFTPAGAGVVGAQTPPVERLFFNTNMFGLFTNWPNYFFNQPSTPYAPLNHIVPVGYANEILFPNKFYSNVADYRNSPYSGVPPLGYVPLAQQKVYWINEQEILSTDSLWSPISSIVFTSTLLPIRAEQTGPPVILGTGNNNPSQATAQSAFQPIITDIALNTASGGAQDYRSFIYYAPTAEYRLTDFGPSKQDIRNIDIQVYWKCRLDNNLYPITMFNLSSVSIKCMFRHKDALGGKTADS